MWVYGVWLFLFFGGLAGAIILNLFPGRPWQPVQHWIRPPGQLDPGCVICGAASQPAAGEFLPVTVCADVKACTRRRHARLAADGKLDES